MGGGDEVQCPETFQGTDSMPLMMGGVGGVKEGVREPEVSVL